MSEEPAKPIEVASHDERPLEKLGHLGIAHEVEVHDLSALDFSRLMPVSPRGDEKERESLRDRCYRFVTRDVFARLDYDAMYPDPESKGRWADLHGSTVLYNEAQDITINISSRLLVKPRPGWEMADFASQGGSVSTLDYLKNQQESDPEAIEGFKVKIDFFKGKFPPSPDSFDEGYEDYFGMDPYEAALRNRDPDEESVEQLGHFEMVTGPKEGSSLEVYLSSEDDPKRISPDDIATFTEWIHAAQVLPPEES